VRGMVLDYIPVYLAPPASKRMQKRPTTRNWLVNGPFYTVYGIFFAGVK